MAKRHRKPINSVSEKEKLEREFRFYWKALGECIGHIGGGNVAETSACLV